MEKQILLVEALQKENIICRENEPLAGHTTMKIGGPARVFCQPAGTEQLIRCIQLCREHQVEYYLLGKGSNTLFADSGYPGAVICLDEASSRIQVEDDQIIAGAGAPLHKVCRAALNAELGGLEFAYGIPGSVGGAVYMNAGAYGGEMKDVLAEVYYIDENGRMQTKPAEELKLGYRTSCFMDSDQCIVAARFVLHPARKQEIEDRMEDLMERRRSKQPLEYPSAGSTFKRPQGAFAGALIEQCGLKGMRVGGAAISEKHCGFVVNLGGATCRDVVELTQKVHDIVLEKTGFVLEREIRVVGE